MAKKPRTTERAVKPRRKVDGHPEPHAKAAGLEGWTYRGTAHLTDARKFAELWKGSESAKGIRAILTRRHAEHLRGLSPRQRARWLEQRTQSILKKPPEDRFEVLYTRWEREGIWRVRRLVDGAGRPIGEFSRLGQFIQPRIILQAADGSLTTLPTGAPLPAIHGAVDRFVCEQRKVVFERVPRGRKRGTLQTGTLRTTFLLAYLKSRGVRNAALLALCGREVVTSQDLRWLRRRLQIGQQMLGQFKATRTRLDSMPTASVADITRALLITEAKKTNPGDGIAIAE